MAIQNINFNPKPEKGVSYSAITDSSVDWTGITNSTYFYDKATDLPYYKNSSGDVVSLFEEGGGGGSTIYTADGALTGNRTVDLDGNVLSFEDSGNTGSISFKSVGRSVFKSVNASGNQLIFEAQDSTGTRIFEFFNNGNFVTPTFYAKENTGGSINFLNVGRSAFKGNNTASNQICLEAQDSTGSRIFEVRNNGNCIIAGNSFVSSENISLQGDTLITKKLELSTTTDGFLMPRLTTAQKNAISSPDTNLMVFDTDLASIERYDGANWVAQANYGLISINDSNGTPVFYNNLNGAISAASGGQTIELHGDVVESSNTMITIDKELTINMNGYMYSCTSTGTADAVYINTSSKVKILNGTIKRSGGTYGGTSNRTLVVASDSNLELTGTDIINTTGISLYSTGADTNILNGKFITTGQTISQVSVQSVANITGSIFESSAYNNFNGVLFNVKATSTSTNVLKGGYANFCEFRQTNASGYDAILLTNGSKGVHCKAYNVSTNYPAIRISGANTEINFCYGYSTLDNGIEVASGTPKGIYDCIGVNVSGANKYGGQISSLEDGVYNSTFIGLGGYGALYNTGTDNKFVKCNFVNKNSSVSNAAFYDTSAGTVRVYDCFSEQADSSKPNLRFTNALRVVYLAGNKLQGGTGVSIAHVDGNSQNTSTDDYGNIILS